MKRHTFTVVATDLASDDQLDWDRLVKFTKNTAGTSAKFPITPEPQLVLTRCSQPLTYCYDWRNVSARAAADRQDLCHFPLLPLMVCAPCRLTVEMPDPAQLR